MIIIIVATVATTIVVVRIVGHVMPATIARMIMQINVNKENEMWTIKKFKTAKAKQLFIENNKHRLQIVEILINNGYAIEYKPLRWI